MAYVYEGSDRVKEGADFVLSLPDEYMSLQGNIALVGAALGFAYQYLALSGSVTVSGVATLQVPVFLQGTGAVAVTGSAVVLATTPLHAAGAIALSGVAHVLANPVLHGVGAIAVAGAAHIKQQQALHGSGAIALVGSLHLNQQQAVHAAGALALGGSLHLGQRQALHASSVLAISGSGHATVESRWVSVGPENDLLDTSARRARAYVELARPGWNARFEHTAHNQHVNGLGTQPGVLGLTQVEVCRLGDMHSAMALVSGDGPLGAKAITVRTQIGAESFGFPVTVYTTTDAVHGLSLCSAYNPYFGTGSRRAAERTLLLAIWHGTTTRLFTSNDRGSTWAQVWSGTADQPKLLTHAVSGLVYMFYTAGGSILYRRADANPELWTAANFAWSAGPTSINTGAGAFSGVYDILHDEFGWLLARATLSVVTAGRNFAANPASGAFINLPNVAQSGTTWIRVGRTGGHDEFGDFPQGRPLVLASDGGAMYYFVASASGTTWDVGENGFTVNDNAGGWGNQNYGFYDAWTTPPPNKFSTQFGNRLVWNSVTTPSTSVSYATGTEFGGSPAGRVAIDNHGPGVGNNDVADHFASFWTRSAEGGSVAFPPYDPTKDLEIEFWLYFHKSEYHNIWFVIDDPLHPKTPLFKIDYYVGRDATGGHAHDTARGMRVTFCRSAAVPDHPVSNPGAVHGENPAYYQHPLDYMFDGFASRSSNPGPHYFKIVYTHTDDMFRLYHTATRGGTYTLWNPYGDREFVDVGTENSYVASATEKYHTCPRGDIWPTRFYIGCPETKPAIEKQSGITVGPLFVFDPNQNEVGSVPSGRGCLVRRLSGGVDLFFVDQTYPDIIRRIPYGYDWQDVWTAQSWRSTWAMNGGPDQATLTMLDIDNAERNSLYGNVRGWRAMMHAKAGSLERGTAQLWGRWVPLFFGTADTGQPLDSGDGPVITAQLYSPLRAATRTFRSQSFTSIPPPPVVDAELVPLDPPVPDLPKVRLQNVIYLVDFDHPANPALQLWDDYIAGYVWQIMCGQDLTKLSVPRVGLQPANFTVNSSGSDTDAWEDMRRLWDDLGLVWYYDFFTGGVLRALRRNSVMGEHVGVASFILKCWQMLGTPLNRQEDDWGRAGNVQISAQNREDRPNMGVARPAPWPDGAGTVDKTLDILGARYSQWALAEMSKKDLPLQALYKEWEGSRQLTPEVPAFPYLTPGMYVTIDVDNPDWPAAFRAFMLAHYKDLARLWYIMGVETEWDGQRFVSRPLLVDPTPFPV